VSWDRERERRDSRVRWMTWTLPAHAPCNYTIYVATTFIASIARTQQLQPQTLQVAVVYGDASDVITCHQSCWCVIASTVCVHIISISRAVVITCLRRLDTSLLGFFFIIIFIFLSRYCSALFDVKNMLVLCVNTFSSQKRNKQSNFSLPPDC